MTLPELPLKSIQMVMVMVMVMLLLGSSLANPQQFLLAEDLTTATGTGTGTGNGADAVPINDPSDLSAGLNFAPVGSLIAAAANAVPPAPVQFIRTAMNSGL
ncbi:uncharacterized protein LOC108148117 isoform X1 [Drosophila elegans]|uniref:uncharacterized protein LOC108148117 isoform X1 n=1 Tax=Drosophila elegans TaxID=30023 RepID=UPI001BC85ABB|nr:uncharacterized protein LOC108148117 isoform X1 [Drosophila elegans]